MRQIHRLVIQGYTHQEIQQQLGLAEKTYYRYLNAVFEHDRARIFNYVTNNELLNQTAILEGRITDLYRTMYEIACDKEIDASVRVNAVSIAAELAFTMMKAYKEAPPQVIVELRKAIPALKRLAIPLEVQQQAPSSSKTMTKEMMKTARTRSTSKTMGLEDLQRRLEEEEEQRKRDEDYNEFKDA